MAMTQTACARGWPDSRLWGARVRAERTLNMLSMLVTLDVSKLSGWLNAYARCRVKRKAYDAVRGAAREAGRAWGGGDASGLHGEGPTQGWGSGHAQSARRTWHPCS